MLTKADEQVIAETGLVPPSRLRSLEHALRCLSRDARTAATNHPDGPKSHAAAARDDEFLVIERAEGKPARLRCVLSDLTTQLSEPDHVP